MKRYCPDCEKYIPTDAWAQHRASEEARRAAAPRKGVRPRSDTRDVPSFSTIQGTILEKHAKECSLVAPATDHAQSIARASKALYFLLVGKDVTSAAKTRAAALAVDYAACARALANIAAINDFCAFLRDEVDAPLKKKKK